MRVWHDIVVFIPGRWEPSFWLSRGTSMAVFHDLTLYNPHTFELAVARLSLVMLPNGAVRRPGVCTARTHVY